MNEQTLAALITYVILLLNEPELDAVHVSDVIPARDCRKYKNWTQFVHLNDIEYSRLICNDIFYDKASGWFRRVSPSLGN